MTTGNLYLSFWHIGLDNLPVGSFTNRRITAAAAKRIIDKARQEKRLFCGSDDDLLAPFCERERERHDAFRRVLKKHCGIELSFRDFCTTPDEDGRYSTFPLTCVEIKEPNRLMVVTCSYTFSKIKGKFDLEKAFRIAPASVRFYIFQAK